MAVPSDDERRLAEAVYKMAERYHKLGISVLPVAPGTKAPPDKFLWAKFMAERADASQRYTWYMDPPYYQVGVIGGPISGNLVIIDMDGADPETVRAVYNKWVEDFPILGTLPMVVTGSGRLHLWFRSPVPIAYFSFTMSGVRIEIRPGGHYTVAPPSLHSSGQPYRWERPPWDGIPIVDATALGLPSRPLSNGAEDVSPFTPGDPLTDAERDEIVTLLSPHWHPGARHDVALATAGWLAGKDVPEADAWGVVASLANEGDDRRALRRAVRDTYRKAADGVSTVGWSRLNDRLDPLISPATAKALDLLLRHRDTTWEFPTTDAPVHPWVISAADLLAEPDEGDAWLCDELVRAETVTWIAGQPKTLKSWIMLSILTAISSGVPALGTFNVEKARPVVLVQEESARRYLRRRLAASIAGMDLTPAGLGKFWVVTNQRFRIDKPDHIKRFLDEVLNAHNPAIVGLDPFRSFHWMDENSADEMARVMDLLLRIRDEYLIALILIHHMNKNILARDSGEQLRGSSVLWSAADGALFVAATDRTDTITVNTILKEGGQAPPFRVRAEFNEAGTRAAFKVVHIEAPKTVSDPAVLAAVTAVAWRTQEELAEAVGLSVRTLYQRLAVLVNNGHLVRYQPHRRAKARYAVPDCATAPPE